MNAEQRHVTYIPELAMRESGSGEVAEWPIALRFHKAGVSGKPDRGFKSHPSPLTPGCREVAGRSAAPKREHPAGVEAHGPGIPVGKRGGAVRLAACIAGDQTLANPQVSPGCESSFTRVPLRDNRPAPKLQERVPAILSLSGPPGRSLAISG